MSTRIVTLKSLESVPPGRLVDIKWFGVALSRITGPIEVMYLRKVQSTKKLVFRWLANQKQNILLTRKYMHFFSFSLNYSFDIQLKYSFESVWKYCWFLRMRESPSNWRKTALIKNRKGKKKKKRKELQKSSHRKIEYNSHDKKFISVMF